jgi:hypothetical protein
MGTVCYLNELGAGDQLIERLRSALVGVYVMAILVLKTGAVCAICKVITLASKITTGLVVVA